MTHTEKTQKLVQQIQQFYIEKKPFRIFHGSTNSTRIQEFDKNTTIDTSFLNEVLEVDEQNFIATVEPNVPMDKLVNETLKYNLLPAVVMEFPGITVGGGIAGVAGESSSFKFGVFAETVKEIEAITPEGEIHTTSEEEKSDLFSLLKGTYGTLGIITKVKLQLVPARKYVNLTYLPIHSYDEAIQTLLEE